MTRAAAIALLLAACAGSEAMGQCDGFALAGTHPSDTAICHHDSVLLHVTGSFPVSIFQWQDSVTAWVDIIGAVDDSLLVSPDATTFYRCLVACVDTATISDTIQVVVHPTPTVDVSVLATGPFCGVFNDTLIATGADTYTWIPTTGLEPTVGDTVISALTNSITYQVVGENTFGCLDTFHLDIDVHVPPSVTYPADMIICGTDVDTSITFILVGTAPVNFTLAMPDDTIDVDGYDQATFSVDSLHQGTYQVLSLDDGLCTASEITGFTTVTVIEPLDGLDASAIEATICEQDLADLTVTLPPDSFLAHWTIIQPSPSFFALINQDQPSAVLDPDTTGLYTIEVTVTGITGACPPLLDTVTVLVVALNDPINAGADTSMCAGTPFALQGSDPFPGTGTWTILSGPDVNPTQFSDVHSPAALFSPTAPGPYGLLWSVVNAPCIPASDTVNINVIQPDVLPGIIGLDDSVACDGEYQTFILQGGNIPCTWHCDQWELPELTGDTANAHWSFPEDPPATATITLTIGGGCPTTAVFDFQLSTSPASCPKGIVYFEPHGLAVLDPSAHYFQWGRLEGSAFIPDAARMDQTTFDAEHITGCDPAPYYVVRTSIDGAECWSTTLFCATDETLARACGRGGTDDDGVEVRAYPDPSHGGPVTIEAVGNDAEPLRIDLSDMRGRSVASGVLPLQGVSKLVLDLDHLQRGVYVLRARNAEVDRAIKLVID